MGGYGSGRRLLRSPKNQVEWSLILDVGILSGRPVVPGREDTLSLRAPRCTWSVEAWYIVRNNGRLKLSIFMPVTEGLAEFHLDLALVRMASGGERPYLLCPGLLPGGECGRRVAKLYWPLRGGMPTFACRSCHRLAYRSSQERPIDLAKLRAKVYRPRKPLPSLEMSRRQYERLRAKAAAAPLPAADPTSSGARQG